MEILRLYYPAKPYIITQAWGIANPIYRQNGIEMDRHNGEDFRIGDDKLVHCPLPAKVLEVGYNDTAGNFVRLRSTEQWIVGGVICYVWFMVMHLEKALCASFDTLAVGDVIGIPDNTGFSTGPHTHISYRRLNEYGVTLDTDPATNNTFDPHPYWVGVAAQDYGTIIHLFTALASTLSAIVGQLTKKQSA